jgi:excinuclease ABC subunit A
VTGRVAKIDDVSDKGLASADLVIDRVSLTLENKSRFIEGLDRAFKIAQGYAHVTIADGSQASFSSKLECLTCKIPYRDPTPVLLSFNHPAGACSACQGYGNVQEIDWNLVTPDMNGSIKSKAIAPLNFGKHAAYYAKIANYAVKVGLDPGKLFERYSAEEWKWLREGDGKRFYGLVGYFDWLDSKKYKMHYRVHASRFKKYVPCADCGGNRLGREGLACKIAGRSIVEVADFTIADLGAWIHELVKIPQRTGQDAAVETHESGSVREASDEAEARISYLQRVGLGYLNLNRLTSTLSGGEMQRINMARCLGSKLTDTLYCLDEPTAGLHARDSRTLLGVIRELCDHGNTAVVVEHERALINGADLLIQIGPEAGRRGGYLEYVGLPMNAPNDPDIAPRRLQGRKPSKFIKLQYAAIHNLLPGTVEIPLDSVTVVCGVSGSGKTSLVQHCLYPALLKYFGDEGGKWVQPCDSSVQFPRGGDVIAGTQLVTQSVLSRSSRSNIATYLGIFDQVRKIFADQPMAKKLAISPGHFSFNVAGGRCETCRGLGLVVEDLSFLGEMQVKCPSCDGRCFSDEVLSVEYRGKTILDVLNITVDEARELFFDERKIASALDQVTGLGLGYLTLGQNTSSFSGGEAQRIKLLKMLTGADASEGPSILIFDEPTTGLSDKDVANLLKQFTALAERGHTVVIIEHHLMAVARADWVIELGPGAAHLGGKVIFSGTPEALAKHPESVTAPFLDFDEKS